MARLIQPMLAGKAPYHLQYPLLASPKIDGVRALIVNGKVMSRKMKEIPNEFVQRTLGHLDLQGFDGELCVGNPWDYRLMQQTMSGVMSQAGEPEFLYYVFDVWDMPAIHFYRRVKNLESRIRDLRDIDRDPVVFLPQVKIETREELNRYEDDCLNKGYEGVMLRDPGGIYKYGRSTAKEGYLLKLKRWTDDEAVIIGFKELMRNKNEATLNEVGKTKRSSHKANMVSGGMLGAFIVRDLKTGQEFDVGGGMTDEQRKSYWFMQKALKGKILTYKHFDKTGVKDAPRFPIFKSLRDKRDL